MTVISSRFIEAQSNSGTHPSHAPDKPVILSPADDAVNINQVPQFQGSVYKHYYNTPMYAKAIQISPSDSFLNNAYEAEEISRTPVFQIPLGENDTPYLSPDTKYYARIRYQDTDLNWGAWSEAICFTTMAVFPETVLATPVIILPVDGGEAAANNPVMSMSAPAALIGTADFSAADWQISDDNTFATTLYNAADTTNITLNIPENLDLSTKSAAMLYARGRQKTSAGDYTDWSKSVHFKISPEYDNPIFGFRRIFSKRTGYPTAYNIDLDGNPIYISQKYFDNHPLYQFPVTDIPVGETLTSSVALILPCWIKHSVYDNANGDMVIDMWFSPYPVSGDGWILHPAFKKCENGFYHGTRLACRLQDSDGKYYFLSKDSVSRYQYGNSTDDRVTMNYLKTFDPLWHFWTIYELRLLFDLMQAEHCTFDATKISTGTSTGNESQNFTWRVFKEFRVATNTPIFVDSTKRLETSMARNEVLTSIGILTPDLSYKNLEVSYLKLNNEAYSPQEYLSEIMRGYDADFGFDLAILGIAKKIEAYAEQTSNPYGANTKVIFAGVGGNTSNSAYYDYGDYIPGQSGLFAFVPYWYNSSAYFRISKNK